ncbi:DinB family protein [Chryseomicrobium excrementi]|uniref:DinB family protein n=1 Tax=Chryseomicrobium excrementi TaxID=2041346 RepID=UPI0013FD5BEB|nr:DinB family protein [Chryseomicrobium excrementi]
MQRLRNYAEEAIHFKPSAEAWSICQVTDHCLVVAHEYLDAVEACATAESREDSKTQFGAELFERGGFPPIKITLPPDMNQPPNNSLSREELEVELVNLNMRMNEVEKKVASIPSTNRVKHGGFGWLNASEWHSLVDMHFRHHERQLSELDLRMKGGL